MSIRRPFELCAIGGAFLVLTVRPAHGLPTPVPPQTVSEEALNADRERFRLGMQRYEAGAFAQAIEFWEPIYRELGAERGYRLAYDLGVAYVQVGDTAAAAERLRAFVAGVDLRRSRGETLAAIVEREEADARARIAILAARETGGMLGEG
ncbi:MAG: hypothetical protein M3O36_14780, partial [Myxococcota bacterium]|nr:hypothetical protein [Myxococcota bacterium]